MHQHICLLFKSQIYLSNIFSKHLSFAYDHLLFLIDKLWQQWRALIIMAIQLQQMHPRKVVKKEPSDHNSSDEQQKQQKLRQRKLSDYRDYISMRASNHVDKNKKKMPKKMTQKHSLRVHAHLQPDILEDDEDIQPQQNADPIALMANYTTEEYNKFIEMMKSRIQNQKPKTDVSQELLDALALKDTNVCIYGFGSKIQYVRYIMKTYLADHNIWEVNGYRQGLTDKKVYNNFGSFLIKLKILLKAQKITIDDQFEEFRGCLTQYALKNKKDLIVVFHCIDSINFLDTDSQVNLSKLFSLPRIKLICTVDNIKIASMWHPKVKTDYNFKFFHINTHVPNIKQQLFRPNPTDARQQEDQAIIHIFQSLNNNQKKILKLFAKKELDNCVRQEPEYYTLETLLDDCIDNVILSSDTQLRENLFELLDHKVLVHKEKIQPDRVRKYYAIQCNKVMLEKIYLEKIQE